MPAAPEDEGLHPVEHGSEQWSDSLYFNAWDPGSRTFLMTRMAVLPNARRRTAGFLVWLDGVPAYGYGREDASAAGAVDGVLSVAGLTYRMEHPLSSWSVELADGDDRAELRWAGYTGCFSYDDNVERLPRAVAWGHYEQTCTVRGTLAVAGRRLALDGVGQRDHSWGFRHWGGLREWHWVTGFFGTERSFNLFHVVQHDGTVTASGFVHTGGRDVGVVAARRRTDEGAGRSPRAFTLVLTAADGEVFEVAGEAAGTDVPVRPADGTVVHEVPMALRGDGAEGFGVYELLENDTASPGEG